MLPWPCQLLGTDHGLARLEDPSLVVAPIRVFAANVYEMMNTFSMRATSASKRLARLLEHPGKLHHESSCHEHLCDLIRHEALQSRIDAMEQTVKPHL
jgi:hypothetical protein